jgi:catechol 2,3-dioxygenase-like lactoylglutathione lyase family enzyme
MLSLGIPVVGVTDLPRAVTFWTTALDLVELDDGSSDAWATLAHRDGSGRALGLQLSRSPIEAHPRMHLDLFVASAEEQRAETSRLLALGARRVDWDSYPDDPDFVVLADPDGNVFCIVDLGHTPA